jgi:hypothetical protein
MSAKSEIQIVFSEDSPEEFRTSEELEETLKAFHGDICDVFVTGLDHTGKGELGFELYSGRYRNLLWQQDLLKRFLQDKYAEQVEIFQTNVWMTSDDESYLFDKDDGNDFKDL